MPAPEDLQDGGNIGRIWDKIDNMKEDINQIKTDVAVIKEQVGRLCNENKLSTENKSKIMMIFIGAATSMVFTAFLHVLMGN